mgnify:CR=1 FL=1
MSTSCSVTRPAPFSARALPRGNSCGTRRPRCLGRSRRRRPPRRTGRRDSRPRAPIAPVPLLLKTKTEPEFVYSIVFPGAPATIFPRDLRGGGAEALRRHESEDAEERGAGLPGEAAHETTGRERAGIVVWRADEEVAVAVEIGIAERADRRAELVAGGRAVERAQESEGRPRVHAHPPRVRAPAALKGRRSRNRGLRHG